MSSGLEGLSKDSATSLTNATGGVCSVPQRLHTTVDEPQPQVKQM